METEVLRIEVVQLVGRHNLFVGWVKLHRIAGAAVESFGRLHRVAVVDLVIPHKIADLEHYMRAVDHTTGLKVAFGRMKAAVLVIDYAVAERCTRFELRHLVDTKKAARNLSILLVNCSQKSIRSCFPAANINEIQLSCIFHIPKMSSVDDHQTFLPDFPSIHSNCVYSVKTPSNLFADYPASCHHLASFPSRHRQYLTLH